jgi:hypothetical protein
MSSSSSTARASNSLFDRYRPGVFIVNCAFADRERIYHLLKPVMPYSLRMEFIAHA